MISSLHDPVVSRVLDALHSQADTVDPPLLANMGDKTADEIANTAGTRLHPSLPRRKTLSVYAGSGNQYRQGSRVRDLLRNFHDLPFRRPRQSAPPSSVHGRFSPQRRAPQTVWNRNPSSKIDGGEVILSHAVEDFQEVFANQTMFYNAKQPFADAIVCK